jgi:hypothetical protein
VRRRSIDEEEEEEENFAGKNIHKYLSNQCYIYFSA